MRFNYLFNFESALFTSFNTQVFILALLLFGYFYIKNVSPAEFLLLIKPLTTIYNSLDLFLVCFIFGVVEVQVSLNFCQ